MPKVIASMATFPERKETIENVVKSIIEQVDKLYIYFNNYDFVPSFVAQYPNIIPILSYDSYGDISASGKMIFLDFEKTDEIIAIIIDDDFLYPDNYVYEMLQHLNHFDDNVVVTVHGSVLPDIAEWYYERSITYGIDQNIDDYKVVNLLGSGTTVLSLSHVNISMDDFLSDVSVDLTLSLLCLKAGVPIVVTPRQANWLRHLNHKGLFEIFKKKKGTYHDDILKGEDIWKLRSLKKIWLRLIKKEFSLYNSPFKFALDKEIDLDFIATLENENIPLSFGVTLKNIDRLKQFYIK